MTKFSFGLLIDIQPFLLAVRLYKDVFLNVKYFKMRKYLQNLPSHTTTWQQYKDLALIAID
ncbi:MAG: hypothetical protein R3E32_05135 [Chitinophagales bacterium]